MKAKIPVGGVIRDGEETIRSGTSTIRAGQNF